MATENSSGSGMTGTMSSWINAKFLNEPAYAWAIFLIALTIFLWIWGAMLRWFEKAV